MQNYNTTIGVIQMRQNECSLSVIQNRYGIGSGTVQLILKRFNASDFTLEQLKQLEPSEVEVLFTLLKTFNAKKFLCQIFSTINTLTAQSKI